VSTIHGDGIRKMPRRSQLGIDRPRLTSVPPL
jgi:hypothetical protein